MIGKPFHLRLDDLVQNINRVVREVLVRLG
jgi:hypothetical protein